MKKKNYVKPQSERIQVMAPHLLSSSEYIYKGTPNGDGGDSEDPDKENWLNPRGDTGDYWLAE
ncbi:MAG TPA: hypothetical protein DD401_00690 [Prevotella sp.]|nr:hypothetical protein [Prevotella sp.]